MTVTVTTPAETTWLATISDAQAIIGSASAGNDAVVEMLLGAATEDIEGFCGRTFRRESVTEKMGADGRRVLMLSRTPVVSVSAVRYNGTLVTDYSVASFSAGTLYRKSGWTDTRQRTLEYGSITALANDAAEPLWEVDYVAGYALPGDTDQSAPVLPSALRTICLTLVRSLWNARSRDSAIESESYPDVASYKYRGSEEMVKNFKGQLQPWVRTF